MEFTFRSRKVEVCIRLGRVYNVALENYLGSAVNVRVGKTVWTTGKGLRKLGQA
jgi:hypothetical protein